jgi:hypothetical protein
LGEKPAPIPHLQARGGQDKANPKIITSLPGNPDNMIFNYLRLLPGVLAAGEQTRDYMIWGSYKGQSHIVFDGMTLFNMGNMRDDAGAVNSLMIKDIEVFKGGYHVDRGDRVGGFVNITGKAGDREDFTGRMIIGNQSASAILNSPLAKRHTLQAAVRSTYPNVLELPILAKQEHDVPRTYFQDLNLKLSGKTQKRDHYHLSLIGSRDRYSAEGGKSKEDAILYAEENIRTHQWGGAFHYGKNWDQVGHTQVTAAYSALASDYRNFLKVDELTDTTSLTVGRNNTSNGVSEISLRIKHHLPSNRWHSLSFGGAYIRQSISFQQDSAEYSLADKTSSLDRLQFYIKDRIQLHRTFSITPGVKMDIPFGKLRAVPQPRIQADFTPNEHFRLNWAWGMYHQFVAENPFVDQFGNHLYQWNVATREIVPVLWGTHQVLGGTWRHKGFCLRLEGYHKTVNDMIRYVPTAGDVSISKGKARTYGMDVQVRQRLKKHEFRLAYTLSKTEELFDSSLGNTYRRAPHDQRHEFKAVGIFNFHPFHFSLDYVYGSGIPENDGVDDSPIYSRLDLSAVYRFQLKKMDLSTGVSIINLLNHANVRYDNFSHFPDSETIYAKAMPFTPGVSLEIGF